MNAALLEQLHRYSDAAIEHVIIVAQMRGEFAMAMMLNDYYLLRIAQNRKVLSR